jgi:hypothetical protein
MDPAAADEIDVSSSTLLPHTPAVKSRRVKLSLAEYHRLPFKLAWKQEYIDGWLVEEGRREEADPWLKWRRKQRDEEVIRFLNPAANPPRPAE